MLKPANRTVPPFTSQQKVQNEALKIDPAEGEKKDTIEGRKIMGWFGSNMGEYTMDLIRKISDIVTQTEKIQ